jgi:hypothetical protein
MGAAWWRRRQRCHHLCHCRQAAVALPTTAKLPLPLLLCCRQAAAALTAAPHVAADAAIPPAAKLAAAAALPLRWGVHVQNSKKSKL